MPGWAASLVGDGAGATAFHATGAPLEAPPVCRDLLAAPPRRGRARPDAPSRPPRRAGAAARRARTGPLSRTNDRWLYRAISGPTAAAPGASSAAISTRVAVSTCPADASSSAALRAVVHSCGLWPRTPPLAQQLGVPGRGAGDVAAAALGGDERDPGDALDEAGARPRGQVDGLAVVRHARRRGPSAPATPPRRRPGRRAATATRSEPSAASARSSSATGLVEVAAVRRRERGRARERPASRGSAVCGASQPLLGRAVEVAAEVRARSPGRSTHARGGSGPVVSSASANASSREPRHRREVARSAGPPRRRATAYEHPVGSSGQGRVVGELDRPGPDLAEVAPGADPHGRERDAPTSVSRSPCSRARSRAARRLSSSARSRRSRTGSSAP